MHIFYVKCGVKMKKIVVILNGTKWSEESLISDSKIS